MWKRISSVMVPVLLVCTFLVQSVQAAQQKTSGSTVDLTFKGTTAVCSAVCRGSSTSDTVDVTLTLYQGITYEKSWKSSGKG